MTRAERVYRTISRQRLDRVPKGEWQLSPELVAGVLGKRGTVTWEDEAAAREFLGMDLIGLVPEGLSTEREVRAEALDYSRFSLWRQRTDFFIFALIDGPFQRTAKHMGFVEFLLRLNEQNEGIKKIAAREASFGLEVARCALRAGAHGIIIGDDIAYARGTYIHPRVLREIFVPLWGSLVESLQPDRVPVFFHSDGNIVALLPELVAVGFTGVHSLEPSAGIDIARIKRDFGDALCLMGNFDLDFLVRAGEKEIASEVKRIMAVAAPGGGFIFSTSSGCLGGDLPPEKVIFLYRTAQEYGKY